MKSGSEILKEVLEFTGESKNSLAKAIKLKRSQNLYDIESGKVKSISSELSEKIVLAYPKLNRQYLLTGEGEIINESGNSTSMRKVAHKKDLAIDITVYDRAMISINRAELARIMAKVYGKDLEQVLDELNESTIIEAKKFDNLSF